MSRPFSMKGATDAHSGRQSMGLQQPVGPVGLPMSDSKHFTRSSRTSDTSPEFTRGHGGRTYLTRNTTEMVFTPPSIPTDVTFLR